MGVYADVGIHWTTNRSVSASLEGRRLILESGYYRPKLVSEPKKAYRVEITTTKT